MKTVAALIGILLMLSALQPSNAAEQLPISPALALAKAGGNHAQIEAALKAVPTAQKEGMEFLSSSEDVSRYLDPALKGRATRRKPRRG